MPQDGNPGGAYGKRDADVRLAKKSCLQVPAFHGDMTGHLDKDARLESNGNAGSSKEGNQVDL